MSKLEYKSMAFEIKSTSEDGAELTGVGAAFHSIDQRPDIIHPNAYDKHLDVFRRDGVVRDEHQVTTGKIVDAAIEPASGLVIRGLISATSHGMDQRKLLKDGVYKYLSVGHFVLGRTYLETPEEVQAHWDTVGYRPTDDEKIRSAYGARLITEAQPREVSTTFLPMNPNAKIREVKSANGTAPVRGLTFDDHSESALATLEEYQDRAMRLFEKRGADGRTLSRKHQAAFQRLSDRLLSLLDAMAEPETKAVVPFVAAPVVEGEWDASAAEKRLKDWAGGDMAKYRKGFAWYDAAKADDYTSYAYPHHDVRDGKLVTVKRGVEAALAAIDGARGGGTRVPEAERPGVRTHLARHYKQWGGEVPKESKGEGKSAANALYAEFLAACVWNG